MCLLQSPVERCSLLLRTHKSLLYAPRLYVFASRLSIEPAYNQRNQTPEQRQHSTPQHNHQKLRIGKPIHRCLPTPGELALQLLLNHSAAIGIGEVNHGVDRQHSRRQNNNCANRSHLRLLLDPTGKHVTNNQGNCQN